jgi:hypothetical protein
MGETLVNGNGMNLNVSMATNASDMAAVSQIAGQMSDTSPGMTWTGTEILLTLVEHSANQHLDVNTHDPMSLLVYCHPTA